MDSLPVSTRLSFSPPESPLLTQWLLPHSYGLGSPSTSSVLVTCGLFLELEAATSFRIADLERVGGLLGYGHSAGPKATHVDTTDNLIHM